MNLVLMILLLLTEKTGNNLFNSNENHVIKKLSIYPNYQKVFDGINICKHIGIKKIRECCPHFNNWIESIIKNSNLISQTTLY